MNDAQMAQLTLQILSRAQVSMNEIDAAMAVKMWLTEMANRTSQSQPSINGAANSLDVNPTQ